MKYKKINKLRSNKYSSLLRSRYLSRHATLLPTKWGGALRDETNNGCVGDYKYSSVVRSVFEHACQLFHRSIPGNLSDEIKRIQRRAMRTISPNLGCRNALEEAGFLSLAARRDILSSGLFNDVVAKKKHKFANLLPPILICKQLRHTRVFDTPVGKTDRFKNSYY